MYTIQVLKNIIAICKSPHIPSDRSFFKKPGSRSSNLGISNDSVETGIGSTALIVLSDHF